MRGGTDDNNFVWNRRAGTVGGRDGKVKEMLRGGGRCVCACKVISVSSFREVVFFSLCVRLWLAGHGAEREEETCARTNDRKCQDCPCCGKEACRGALHFTDDHIRQADRAKWLSSDRARTLTFHETLKCTDSIPSVTSRRNKVFVLL